ncbi:MAG: DUF927 domain-containing protein, partial [Deltaproteobacteria bacterium]|nr:DUF927 domain-containing protein [Deltaproteobacteria bacterium]
DGKSADFNDLHVARGLDAVREALRHTLKLPNEGTPMPSGFYQVAEGKRAGLYKVVIDREGNTSEERVGDVLEVLGHTRDAHASAHGLLLRWYDGEVFHTWAMPFASLHSQNQDWLKVLVDGGYRVQHGMGKALGEFLGKVLPTKLIRCVPRTGWHGAVFVLPDETFYPAPLPIKKTVGQAGQVGQANNDADFSCPTIKNANGTGGTGEQIEQVVLQVQMPRNPYQSAGTFDGWKESIGTWARGNSRIVLALEVGLAGVLLYLLQMDSVGVHFFGGSSKGKSTALAAGASEWGKGTLVDGYIQTWRATANGLEATAALHSDTPLVLDELGQANAQTVEAAAYLIGNGQGKQRANANGLARDVNSWRVTFLSSGEVSLTEKLKEEGRRVYAGQSVRFVEVPALVSDDLGVFEDIHGFESPQAFADALKKASATHYGHAARAFIRRLQTEGLDVVKARLEEDIEAGIHKLTQGPDGHPRKVDGQVIRVMKFFLLCASAGQLATEWGIFPWDAGEAEEAVQKCFKAWLTVRGGVGAAEEQAILEQAHLVLEQHGHRFQNIQERDAVCINRIGFWEDKDGGTWYYIPSDTFKKEFCAGHTVERVGKVLKEHGLLLPDDDGKHNTRKPPTLPGLGRPRCYVLCIKNDEDAAA